MQPFPLNGSKYLVAGSGARDPLWSPDGTQLFYALTKGDGFQLIVADVQTQRGFQVVKTTPLPIEGFVSVTARAFDITPDGNQFVVMFPRAETSVGTSSAGQINVTLNWFEELKARVPTK